MKSWFTSPIDYLHRLRRLAEFGILEYLHQEEIRHVRKCQMDDFTRPSDALRPLDLGDFYGVFSVYVGGKIKRAVVHLGENKAERFFTLFNCLVMWLLFVILILLLL